ncbi:type II secretion system F family protein [Thiomicrorhabdus arctica]|uniref:type II secretion system F family protein n=1 Tax=Thiomicrorhabdus arctica TaxID=131540 RepID=UPI00036A0668|nr:type II secretion system F family protein [Thiomicrorhabdus arctica]
MDLGFFIVAFAIMLPFAILSFVVSLKKQQQKQLAVRRLMSRIGLNNLEQKTIQDHLMQQKEKSWFIWFISKFKKAGLNNKHAIIKVVTAQAILLFMSAFILSTKFNVLNDKLILLSIILPLLPSAFVYFKIRQRQTALRQQFPEMLDSIVRSLQSGYGIDGALAAVGEDMQGALAQEMKEVNKQLTIGISMRDVLREFQRRVDLPEAQFFVITLIIQRETGGQLSLILGELAKLMRRRVSFQAKIKTLTAESRFTAWFIGGAPIVYVVYKYFFDKESMQFFLYDPTGFKLFVVSLILIFTGTLILRQMLKMRF